MKRLCKPVALCLSALLSFGLLGGCGRDTGEYYTETPHSEKQAALPVGGEDSGINGYYTLKGAILNMVSMGIAEDVFRVGQYSGDLEADLKVITQEITTTEPIGIYGVSSITVDQTRVLTYRELAVSVQYKRTPTELRTITEIRSRVDLQSRLITMLRTQGATRAFQVGDAMALRDTIQREVYMSWMNCGASAPDLDYVAADFYPEESDKAIMEIRPQYIGEAEEQKARTDAILQRAEEILQSLAFEEEAELAARLEAVALWLADHAEYDHSAQRVVNETGGEQRKSVLYTAYGGLIEGHAAQSGFVLAASVLLDLLDIDHEVVTGTTGEDIYSWIRVEDGDQVWILDVTARQNERPQWLYSAEEADALFIPWQ